MNFSFVIKMTFISFFIFILVYAINFSSIQKDYVTSNNITVKNVVKESLNIGTLRAYGVITFDEEILVSSTIENYIINNNINVDNVTFEYAVNDNILSLKITTDKNVFNALSESYEIFSYEVRKEEE